MNQYEAGCVIKKYYFALCKGIRSNSVAAIFVSRDHLLLAGVDFFGFIFCPDAAYSYLSLKG